MVFRYLGRGPAVHIALIDCGEIYRAQEASRNLCGFLWPGGFSAFTDRWAEVVSMAWSDW
jgi:hypothetical protein